LGVVAKIILKWVLRNTTGVWTGLIWLGIGTIGVLFWKGSEPSGSIKFGENPAWLRTS
jgi:hypothetical protein